jgi:hypothetical protein
MRISLQFYLPQRTLTFVAGGLMSEFHREFEHCLCDYITLSDEY